MKKKLYKDFGISKNDKDYLEKQELYQLYKIPKKDKGLNIPRIQEFEENYKQQADLLFLPDDEGFKYVLVVVDLGNRLTDAEPLKTKYSSEVKEAFEEIYKRGILKLPVQIQMDPGSEFKGETKKYFEDEGVDIRYGIVGRHRNQALVESRNKSIGSALHKRMTAEEILTGEVSRSWVSDLPVIIKSLNKRLKRVVSKGKLISDLPVCEGDSCEILNIGDKVRSLLDNPIDYTTEKRLHGNFRASDIRWNPKVKTISKLMIKPGYPPLYKVKGSKIWYTKNQLQLVDDNEEKPEKRVIRGKPKDNNEDTIDGFNNEPELNEIELPPPPTPPPKQIRKQKVVKSQPITFNSLKLTKTNRQIKKELFDLYEGKYTNEAKEMLDYAESLPDNDEPVNLSRRRRG
ncbi:hypothetical protein DLAC_05872 [Tieghemostelium lacteum]|uniref:Integrase catalytic domain-containing protein n=1 Tax=Tieghemostelium lacteum TaxID=361077 RepID=A0A151ZH42_TIELA|nr:hypothetical protein DLAC_05872 [Tieghemostelium lacteum]|eukprot:KYQ93229.1 hypothetical protein DLAC_05872 [Tieghemostelium lacteum]